MRFIFFEMSYSFLFKKLDFGEYIMNRWKRIVYDPGEVEISSIYDDYGEDDDTGNWAVSNQNGGTLTPNKVQTDPDKFAGVVIKHLPRDTDHAEIIEFLVKSGLPECYMDNVLIKSNVVLCKLFIEKIEDLNPCTNEGKTPIYFANVMNHRAVVSLLRLAQIKD